MGAGHRDGIEYIVVEMWWDCVWAWRWVDAKDEMANMARVKF